MARSIQFSLSSPLIHDCAGFLSCIHAMICHTDFSDSALVDTVDMGVEDVYVNADSVVEDAGIEHTVVVGKEDDQYNKQPQLTQTGTISF